MATPKQTDPQFKLRLPLDLKERIELAAHAENRSMNAEILARLNASFETMGDYQVLAVMMQDFGKYFAAEMSRLTEEVERLHSAIDRLETSRSDKT
ncbi:MULTISPECIES: Arc family DNA-binding protein [Salipiger]|uniref:Arc family DNA-binding protein n=1 Tax=Salipiger TaxID=263377 RepID=UPI003517604B